MSFEPVRWKVNVWFEYDDAAARCAESGWQPGQALPPMSLECAALVMRSPESFHLVVSAAERRLDRG